MKYFLTVIFYFSLQSADFVVFSLFCNVPRRRDEILKFLEDVCDGIGSRVQLSEFEGRLLPCVERCFSKLSNSSLKVRDRVRKFILENGLFPSLAVELYPCVNDQFILLERLCGYCLSTSTNNKVYPTYLSSVLSKVSLEDVIIGSTGTIGIQRVLVLGISIHSIIGLFVSARVLSHINSILSNTSSISETIARLYTLLILSCPTELSSTSNILRQCILLFPYMDVFTICSFEPSILSQMKTSFPYPLWRIHSLSIRVRTVEYIPIRFHSLSLVKNCLTSTNTSSSIDEMEQALVSSNRDLSYDIGVYILSCGNTCYIERYATQLLAFIHSQLSYEDKGVHPLFPQLAFSFSQLVKTGVLPFSYSSKELLPSSPREAFPPIDSFNPSSLCKTVLLFFYLGQAYSLQMRRVPLSSLRALIASHKLGLEPSVVKSVLGSFLCIPS